MTRIVLREKKCKHEEVSNAPMIYAVLYRTGEFIGVFASALSAYRAAATRMLSAHSFEMENIYATDEDSTFDGDKVLRELQQLYMREEYERIVEQWNGFLEVLYEMQGVDDDDDMRIDVEVQPLLP